MALCPETQVNIYNTYGGKMSWFFFNLPEESRGVMGRLNKTNVLVFSFFLFCLFGRDVVICNI